jgi:hypothetical protein
MAAIDDGVKERTRAREKEIEDWSRREDARIKENSKHEGNMINIVCILLFLVLVPILSKLFSLMH